MGCVISVHTEKRWEGNGGGIGAAAGREGDHCPLGRLGACVSINIRQV